MPCISWRAGQRYLEGREALRLAGLDSWLDDCQKCCHNGKGAVRQKLQVILAWLDFFLPISFSSQGLTRSSSSPVRLPARARSRPTLPVKRATAMVINMCSPIRGIISFHVPKLGERRSFRRFHHHNHFFLLHCCRSGWALDRKLALALCGSASHVTSSLTLFLSLSQAPRDSPGSQARKKNNVRILRVIMY